MRPQLGHEMNSVLVVRRRVAFVNGGLTVKTLDTSTRDKGYLRLLPANPDFKPIIIDANDQFIIQGRVTSIHRDIRRH